MAQPRGAVVPSDDQRDLTAAVKELTKALTDAERAAGPRGRGAGSFFADPGTRDRLITDIYQSRRFQQTGLTAGSLGMLPDRELLDLSRRLKGTAGAADAAQKAAAAAAAKVNAAMHTLSLLGAGGAAGRVGRARAYGGVLESAGFARLGGAVGRFAGPIGAAVTAGVEGERLARTANALSRDPFLTDAQRAGRLAESVPGLGWAAGAYRDYSGVTARLQSLREFENPARLLRAEGAAEQSQLRFGYARELSTARSQAAAFRDYGPVGLPTADRSTAAGRRLYEEQARLQPQLQGLDRANRLYTAALKDREAATRRVDDAQRSFNEAAAEAKRLADEQKQAEQQRDAARAKAAAAKKDEEFAARFDDPFERRGRAAARAIRAVGQAIAGGAAEDVRVLEVGGRAAAASKLAEQKRLELEQARRDRERTEENVAATDRDRKLAAAAVTRGELGVAEARRDLAEGTAERLGGMGPGGRIAARVAFDLLKSVGVENATPDLIARAEAFAPAEVRAMKVRAGEASAEFQAGRADGLVGFEDVAAAGRRVDELRGKAVGQEAGAEREFLQDAENRLEAGTARFLDKMLELVEKKIDQRIADMEIKIRQGR